MKNRTKSISISNLVTLVIFVGIISACLLTNKASVKVIIFKVSQRIEMASN